MLFSLPGSKFGVGTGETLALVHESFKSQLLVGILPLYPKLTAFVSQTSGCEKTNPSLAKEMTFAFHLSLRRMDAGLGFKIKTFIIKYRN